MQVGDYGKFYEAIDAERGLVAVVNENEKCILSETATCDDLVSGATLMGLVFLFEL